MTNIDDGWDKFITLCVNINKKQQLSDLLKVMLTPEEYDNIAKRMLILEALIKDEWSQREMADKLNVSIAKITRGSNELKRMPPAVREVFERFFAGG